MYVPIYHQENRVAHSQLVCGGLAAVASLDAAYPLGYHINKTKCSLTSWIYKEAMALCIKD